MDSHSPVACNCLKRGFITRRKSTGDTTMPDLQKAFDSVDYPVLLEKLYEIGINGNMWRLFKSWYEDGFCCVKKDKRLSASYPVEMGVKQYKHKYTLLPPSRYLAQVTSWVANTASAHH